MVRAEDLKDIAEKWGEKMSGKKEDPFPLGYFIQTELLNKNLIAVL